MCDAFAATAKDSVDNVMKQQLESLSDKHACSEHLTVIGDAFDASAGRASTPGTQRTRRFSHTATAVACTVRGTWHQKEERGVARFAASGFVDRRAFLPSSKVVGATTGSTNVGSHEFPDHVQVPPGIGQGTAVLRAWKGQITTVSSNGYTINKIAPEVMLTNVI